MFPSLHRDSRGAMLVWVFVLMVVLVGTTAFVIDWGYLLFLQRQLQNLADAASLAAAREFGPVPATPSACTGLALLQDRILCQAQAFADQNQAWALFNVASPAYQGFTLSLTTAEPPAGSPEDVVIVGSWQFGAARLQTPIRCSIDTESATGPLFIPTTAPPTTSNSNAVRVRVMLEGVPRLLARPGFPAATGVPWFSTGTTDVCAGAVATWMGLGQAPPAGVVPLAVPLCLFDSNNDGTPDDVDGDGYPDPIDNQTLYRIPSNVDNSSWTGLLLPNANTNDIRAMINHDPSLLSYMTVSVGQWISLNGGEITPAWVEMQQVYPPGSTVLMPLIDFPCGTPYNQQAEVVGWVTFEITAYTFNPTEGHRIEGRFIWDTDVAGPGGGLCYGTGCRVGLVQ